MSDTIEWAHVAGLPAHLLKGREEANDGNTPNDDDDDGFIAITVEGCALYGTPDEVLGWLSRAKQAVINHMIDEAEQRGPVADAETVLETPEWEGVDAPEVPF